MSERYSKLFALSENLYASGSPVVIAAGALLKDNQTGKVIAQLKLRNISKKVIKAAKVCISPLDTVGKPLGDAVYYQYLDLNAKRDEDFGQKAAIALPNAATRSFAASVEEVAFMDNTVWTATGEPWKMLPQPQPIGLIHGAEMEKQFRIKYGSDCKNLLLTERDLWFCVCGALNHNTEAECHACGKSCAVLSSIDYDELTREKNVRVAAEKEQAEKEAAAARVREEVSRAKAKKIGIVAAVATIIIIAASFVVTKVIIPSNNYRAAEEMLAAGDYDGAIAGFTALSDYKDSAERAIEAEAAKEEAANAAAYTEAKTMLANKNYEDAIAAFEALGNYSNSCEMIDECKYQNALHLMSQKEYTSAAELFYQIPDYKDSLEYISNFCFVPAYIEVSKNTGNDEKYVISYNEDGKMLEAYRSTTSTEKETAYTFDENGVLIREDWKSGWYYRYVVNNDGTISKYTKDDNEIAFHIYDIYGNPASFFYDGEWRSYKGHKYDADHNRCDHSKNYYGDVETNTEGMLALVQYQEGNLSIQSKIGYVCLYIADGVIDMDLIWRNFRIICGESIWR